MDNDSKDILMDCHEEPFKGKLRPRVTHKGNIVKTFSYDNFSIDKKIVTFPRHELPNYKNDDFNYSSNETSPLKRKALPLETNQTELKKRIRSHVELLGLRHLYEGPNMKNRPTEFLESIINLSCTNIELYQIGQRIFFDGMPDWIQARLEKMRDSNKTMKEIAEYADQLLATELMDLPNEMLLKILSFTRCDTTVLNLSKVCQRLCDLCWYGSLYTIVIDEQSNSKAKSMLDLVQQFNPKPFQSFTPYLIVCECFENDQCQHRTSNDDILLNLVKNHQTGSLPLRILMIRRPSNSLPLDKLDKLYKMPAKNKHLLSIDIKEFELPFNSSESSSKNIMYVRDCSMSESQSSFMDATTYDKWKKTKDMERCRQIIQRSRQNRHENDREELEFAYQNGVFEDHLLMRYENEIEEEDPMLYLPFM